MKTLKKAALLLLLSSSTSWAGEIRPLQSGSQQIILLGGLSSLVPVLRHKLEQLLNGTENSEDDSESGGVVLDQADEAPRDEADEAPQEELPYDIMEEIAFQLFVTGDWHTLSEFAYAHRCIHDLIKDQMTFIKLWVAHLKLRGDQHMWAAFKQLTYALLQKRDFKPLFVLRDASPEFNAWLTGDRLQAIANRLIEQERLPQSSNLPEGYEAWDSVKQLSWAAQHGHFIEILKLIKAGANVNVQDGTRTTPLHWAVQNGHAAVVHLLVEACTSVNVQNNLGQTPLSLAASKGHEAIVCALLEAGANVDAQDGNRFTPLRWASCYGHAAVVRILLAAGANVDAQDNTRFTPLHWAALNGHTAVVRLLLAAGANVNARDTDDQTPLHWARLNGHTAVADLLVGASAI